MTLTRLSRAFYLYLHLLAQGGTCDPGQLISLNSETLV